MESGLAQPSIARTALGKQADFGLNDIETAFAVSAPFAAGVGTVIIPFISVSHQLRFLSSFQTLATLDVFFCQFILLWTLFPELTSRTLPLPVAMLHYPEVMKKAQAEIDSVLASNRRPEVEDADALPYVRAMIKETMRFAKFIPFNKLSTEPFVFKMATHCPSGCSA